MNKYRIFKSGDINAFFGLLLDNLLNLVVLGGILIGGFGMPREIVIGKMIPGTAIGVMFGDLVYSYMAYRLAKKTGRYDITAMPLGLDT
ncbi:MAG: MFS transporter, partial [Deltaproteobacteria bacterium]|nr:MFS transporter [Deltaproteobacteria bacterium]